MPIRRTMDGQAEIPAECSQHVFSFLAIQDCARLGLACSATLREVLPNLCRRRNRMKTPYAIVNHQQAELRKPPLSPTSPIQDIEMFKACPPSSQEFGPLTDLQQINSLENLLVFPTVQDLVEQLAVKMPLEHSQARAVAELCNSLRLDLSGDIAAVEGSDYPKTSLIALFVKVMCPLKLHAQIVKHALRQSGQNDHSNGCPLHEYVGDVLIVTYLLSNGSTQFCSSVEGSPTQFCSGAESSYASWVLLHSGILRTKQFSEEQRCLLGIPDFNILQLLTSETSRLSLSAQLYHQRMTAWSVSMDCFREEIFQESELTLVYDDFGPLGPSFRGRDVVRIRPISAQCMLAYFSSPTQRGEAALFAVDWMCLAHSQASKTRPMTVRVPEIRFG